MVYPEASYKDNDFNNKNMELYSNTVLNEADIDYYVEPTLLSEIGKYNLLNYDSISNLLFSKNNSKSFVFRDVFGEEYEMIINSKVPVCNFDKDKFKYDDKNKLTYNDNQYSSRFGIDVSRHLGNINWNKVKEFGVEFVIIRIGYRGYGKAGNLCIDKNFVKNIDGAKKAGLDVGVYIYSQAVNEKEAIEEAEFVLENLGDRKLDMPIVYDPESVLNDVARTDDVTPEQFTKNSMAFCKRIEEAGFEPMIYCNMLWQAFQLDLSKLKGYKIWYADYESKPQTPYHFDFWQYSCTGKVPGINADVDLDIQMIKK